MEVVGEEDEVVEEKDVEVVGEEEEDGVEAG